MSNSTFVRAPSFTSPSAEEFARLDVELAPERRWFKEADRFATEADIEAAFFAGNLALVEADDNLQPIKRFTDHREIFKPYLLQGAASVLSDFGVAWRAELGAFHPEARLAVTSMVRSLVYQQELIKQGVLASADSTHCVGTTFDIDASGYYALIDSSSGATSVGHPDREAQHRQMRNLGELSDQVGYGYNFDQQVTQAAIDVAHQMQSDGLVNVVHEFRDTPNACLHMAVHPDLALSLKRY